MTTAAIRPHTARVPGVDEIRARFPALERVHGGHPVAYFDGPGGTQVPASVVDAMRDYLLHHNSNSHWAYPTSVETDEIIDAVREAAADFLNAAPNEVAFGANMTTLAFSLSRALAPTFAPGDEIVVTELDHHANVAPWTRLAAERGAVVRMARMNTDTGALDWAHLEHQLTARTRLLAIGASSNALGTITDVARATALAHARGALVFIDAVAYAPHALIDVRALGCDFLACSPFKFYGPHMGVLYGRHELLASLDVARLASAPAQAPDRWETGTLNFEALAGSTAAIEFMASLGGSGAGARDGRRARLARAYDAMHARIEPLFATLWSGLAGIRVVRLYGPPPGDAPRSPTVSFTVADVDSGVVATRLANEWGVFASNGNFYAATIAERYGIGRSGFVRAGCACYTTAEEIDRFVSGVRVISASSS
ncbi:MAG TPA: cysteine desulfurase-like protein [Gemmatimonadaceae bacterium]|nr:cysteine desulfurase-like protein [Gemmatimonadaceae bacterium]